jgi:hypothetical protein
VIDSSGARATGGGGTRKNCSRKRSGGGDVERVGDEAPGACAMRGDSGIPVSCSGECSGCDK